MKKLFTFAVLFAFCFKTYAQDTFSIVAVDSITGEVGSAGASCVDLFQAGLPNDDFLGVLFPNLGAINSQAYYIPANQDNATDRMNAGDTPSEIIQWLVDNDVQGQPQFRQYGITALVNGSPQSAAHTGTSTDDYKGHVVGPNYAIQGNILLGQQVLDSMESRFLSEEGDLACKLMAAMQGANMIGADTRCASNGTSSLFAFIKVAQPTDDFGSPSFLVSMRSANNAGIEPIDSLQTLFDAAHNCAPNSSGEVSPKEDMFKIYPNPSAAVVTVESPILSSFKMELFNAAGELVLSDVISNKKTIALDGRSAGIYYLKCSNDDFSVTEKIVVR